MTPAVGELVTADAVDSERHTAGILFPVTDLGIAGTKVRGSIRTAELGNR